MAGEHYPPWNVTLVKKTKLHAVIHVNIYIQAYYVFWAEIGRRMGMKDVPDSLEEMKVWSAVRTTEQIIGATDISIACDSRTKKPICYPRNRTKTWPIGLCRGCTTFFPGFSVSETSSDD